jgi:hypothetical protein
MSAEPEVVKTSPFELIHFQRIGFGGRRFSAACHLTDYPRCRGLTSSSPGRCSVSSRSQVSDQSCSLFSRTRRLQNSSREGPPAEDVYVEGTKPAINIFPTGTARYIFEVYGSLTH